MFTANQIGKNHPKWAQVCLGLCFLFNMAAGADQAQANSFNSETLQTTGNYSQSIQIRQGNPDAPEYNKEFWNAHTKEVGSCQRGTNCFEYALAGVNELCDPSHANPGNSTGDILASAQTVQEQINFAIAEGLEPISPDVIPEAAPGHYLVVLYLTDDPSSYHWIRQNRDGTWSQKSGPEEVSLVTDHNGTPLVEPPEEISGYKKTQYFQVPSRGIDVGPDAYVENMLRTEGIPAVCAEKPQLEWLFTKIGEGAQMVGEEKLQYYKEKFEASLPEPVYRVWKQCDIDATTSMRNQVSEQIQSRM